MPRTRRGANVNQADQKGTSSCGHKAWQASGGWWTDLKDETKVESYQREVSSHSGVATDWKFGPCLHAYQTHVKNPSFEPTAPENGEP